MVAKISTWVIGVIITLLYVSTVVSAVGNFVMLPDMGQAIGYSITAVGWFWLSFGMVMPIIVFIAAIWIPRKRGAVMRLLVLLGGLSLVAAVQLEVMLLVPQSAFFA